MWLAAAVRNLDVCFGPGYGAWSLASGPVAPAVRAAKAGSAGAAGDEGDVEQEGPPPPSAASADFGRLPSSSVEVDGATAGGAGQGAGEGEEGDEYAAPQEEGVMLGAVVATGSSTDLERIALRSEIAKYLKSRAREEALGATPPNDMATTSYFDQVCHLCMCVTCACVSRVHVCHVCTCVTTPCACAASISEALYIAFQRRI
jgi:hypothetical protein